MVAWGRSGHRLTGRLTLKSGIYQCIAVFLGRSERIHWCWGWLLFRAWQFASGFTSLLISTLAPHLQIRLRQVYGMGETFSSTLSHSPLLHCTTYTLQPLTSSFEDL